MKKLSFLLLLLLFLSFVFIYTVASMEEKFEIPNVEVLQFQPDDEDRDSAGGLRAPITEEQVHQGHLLLVNSEHPVYSVGIKSDIVNLSMDSPLVNGYSLFNNNTALSEFIAGEFSNMALIAQKERDYDFFITSGFRDLQQQEVLYQEMGANRALPAGFSEHNLGLSLDVGTSNQTMEKAPEGKWLEKNAWKYGFVIRYPKDKTDITGIQNEPWHIRYVGFPHSAIMKKNNFVLEEYLNYIQKKKKFSAVINGKKYSISYYPYTKNMTIPLPKDLNYDLSGDNMNGIIVTSYESL